MKPSGVQFASPIRPPAPDDAQELGRRAFLVRREHDAVGREDDVEAPVGEGEALRVGDLEGDGKPIGLGASPRLLEELRHVVRRGDVGEPARRRERRVAVAGGDVEHPLEGEEVDRFAERLADHLEPYADLAEVAGGPGRLLAGLDRFQVGVRGRIGEARVRADRRMIEGLGIHGCIPSCLIQGLRTLAARRGGPRSQEKNADVAELTSDRASGKLDRASEMSRPAWPVVRRTLPNVRRPSPKLRPPREGR